MPDKRGYGKLTKPQETRLRDIGAGRRRGNATVTNDATERALIAKGLVRSSVETMHRYGPLTQRGHRALGALLDARWQGFYGNS